MSINIAVSFVQGLLIINNIADIFLNFLSIRSQNFKKILKKTCLVGTCIGTCIVGTCIVACHDIIDREDYNNLIVYGTSV